MACGDCAKRKSHHKPTIKKSVRSAGDCLICQRKIGFVKDPSQNTCIACTRALKWLNNSIENCLNAAEYLAEKGGL
jgi:hypothetical protein